MEEREKIRKEQEYIWNQISAITKEIADLESSLITAYHGENQEEDKEESKVIESIKTEIDALLEEKELLNSNLLKMKKLIMINNLK